MLGVQRRLGCGSGGRQLGSSKWGPEGLGRAFAYPDVAERWAPGEGGGPDSSPIPGAGHEPHLVQGGVLPPSVRGQWGNTSIRYTAPLFVLST